MGSALIKKLPRKLLFSAAALAMAAYNFGLAAYSKKSEEAQSGWIPIVLISIFYVSSSIGVIPIVELLPSEMFPTDIRTLSTGITLGSGIGMAAVATKLFPQMLAALTMSNIFVVFGISCLLLLGWGALFIPENEGVSLVKTEYNNAP